MAVTETEAAVVAEVLAMGDGNRDAAFVVEGTGAAVEEAATVAMVSADNSQRIHRRSSSTPTL